MLNVLVRYKQIFFFLVFILGSNPCFTQKKNTTTNLLKTYLGSLKVELQKKWPKNKQINLIFHGHSVPTGYLTKGVLDRLQAYPFRTMKKITDFYPYAVVNCITTSIGGEQSEQGAKRFLEEVLIYKPDVLFIDYALNDRSIGLKRAKSAWEKMIVQAKNYGCKLILLTPTPDTKENINNSEAKLAKHSKQIKELALKHNVGLVDTYQYFKELSQKLPLESYMAQNNHINQKGHQFVADLIFKYFEK